MLAHNSTVRGCGLATKLVLRHMEHGGRNKLIEFMAERVEYGKANAEWGNTIYGRSEYWTIGIKLRTT